VVAQQIGPLIVIVGETASGKSALAMNLARQFNGEIICADSWTVRKQVNIGTAKPTAHERTIIQHHLVDIIDPCEDFTAAVFKQLATGVIQDVITRGKLPIMVGGTGLYIDGVIYDFGFLPAGDRKLRQVLNRLSLNQLLEQIESRGLSLKGIDQRNKRRLIRLLETNGAQPTKHSLRANTLIIGLHINKNELKTRITLRLQEMLERGLEQEVRLLSKIYGWDCEALKGVGYNEWQGYFLGVQTLEHTKQRIISDTLDLAKRQCTWFNRNKSIHWVSNKSEAVDLITTFLNK